MRPGPSNKCVLVKLVQMVSAHLIVCVSHFSWIHHSLLRVDVIYPKDVSYWLGRIIQDEDTNVASSSSLVWPELWKYWNKVSLRLSAYACEMNCVILLFIFMILCDRSMMLNSANKINPKLTWLLWVKFCLHTLKSSKISFCSHVTIHSLAADITLCIVSITVVIVIYAVS